MTRRAVMIAGTHSGVGKTSVSVGIMAALARRGLKVQPFKVGPDFIDPGHHRRAAGRVSRNLDGWMLPREYNVACFRRHSADADVAVVEGVMGLFDGYDGRSEAGSSAQIAKWLGAPVVLVVDAWALSRSAAALVGGYRSFDPQIRLGGVVFNKIGGPEHLEWLRQAVEGSVEIAILGGIPRDKDVEVPERHLGLLMAEEDRFPGTYLSKLADLVETHLDLDRLLALSVIDEPQAAALASTPAAPPGPRPRIGVARDAAFCFYYADNLELLADAGAEIVEFSPLRDRLPSRLDGLYLGGGYPELYASGLAANRRLIVEVRDFATAGGSVYGECGGLMYLSQGIEDAQGRRFPLCGVFPFWTRMVPKLKLAYAEVRTRPGSAVFPPQETARGHVFHFSEIVGEPGADFAYEVETYDGKIVPEGFQVGRTLASYVHLHFGSNPGFARHLVAGSRGRAA